MSMRCCFLTFVVFVGLTGLFSLVVGSTIVFFLAGLNEFTDTIVHMPAVLMLALGGLKITLSFVGCYGTCRYSQDKLFLYSGLSLFLLMLKLLTGITTIEFSQSTTHIHYDRIDRSMKNYHKSPTDRHAMDFIQTMLNCCGSENYTDYTSDVLPASCCKQSRVECLKTGNETDHYLSGCKRDLRVYLRFVYAKLGGVFLTSIVMEITGAVLSVALAAESEYDQRR